MPYPVVNTLFDALLPRGLYHYWKANFVHEIGDAAVAAHLEHGARTTTLESGSLLMPIDGACRRVGRDETAFGNREAAWSGVIAGAWRDPADSEKNAQWVRDYYEALRPCSEEGGYVNFMSHDDQDRVSSNSGRSFDRLRRVKAERDPGNLFGLNQNVAPVG